MENWEIAVIEDIEAMEAVERPHRTYRERDDAFRMNDRQFFKMFRFPKNVVREIIAMLQPHMIEGNRRSSITVETKV